MRRAPHFFLTGGMLADAFGSSRVREGVAIHTPPFLATYLHLPRTPRMTWSKCFTIVGGLV
jgi:hypothetical protein